MKKNKIVSVCLLNLLLLGLIGNFLHPVRADSEPSTYALDFDGINTHITVPSDETLNFSTGDFTIALWFKLYENDSSLNIIGKHDVDWNGYWYVGTDGEGFLEYTSNINYSGIGRVPFSSEWHSVLAIRDSGTTTLYLDNESVGSGDDNGNVDSDEILYIGGDPLDNDYYINGTIDDIMIFDRALNLTERSYLFNSGVGRYTPLNTTGLMAWWKFDEGSGTTLYDRSGNANHGTISGATWATGYVSEWYAFDNQYVQPNYQATVSSGSYVENQMTFTLTGSSGATSSTKVYCGNLEKPKKVILNNNKYNEGPHWSYDGSNKILTLTWTHASNVDVQINWAGSAIGVYPLSISVLQNGVPTFATVVIAGGENKTLFGSTTFELPYGNYFILVYCGDKRQTKSIFLSGPSSVGFDFTVSEPPNWAVLGWTIPIFIAVVVGIYFLLFRKK